eukprot:g4346.t1
MNEFVLAHLNVAKIQSQRKKSVGDHTVYELNVAVKKRNQLLTKLRDLDLHAMNKIKNDRGEDEVLFAFVTFNTVHEKQIFVERLRRRPIMDLLTCKKFPKFTDDRDVRSTKPREFDVWTRQPHHPSLIIWENLHYTYFACCKRRRRHMTDRGGCVEDLAIRRLFVLLVAIAMILLTFALAVALKTAADDAGTCPSFAQDLAIPDQTCGLCGAHGEDLYSANTSDVSYQQCYTDVTADANYVASEIDSGEVDSYDCSFWRTESPADVDDICSSQYVMQCYCYSNFWTACCFDYWGSYENVLLRVTQYFGFSMSISVVLLIANMSMRKFLSYIVFLERPHTSAKKELASAERILLFQLFNSGLILLFLPINGENALSCDSAFDCSFNRDWYEKLFTKEWYDQTGTLVLSTILCYA